MFFPESDILLRHSPEYEEAIKKVDSFFNCLNTIQKTQINIDVVADLLELKGDIINFIFEQYCTNGLLIKRKYLKCPYEHDIITEIDELELKKLPTIRFCDICGSDHSFGDRDIVERFSFSAPIDTSNNRNDPGENAPQTPQGSLQINEDKGTKAVKFAEMAISKKCRNKVKIAAIQLDYDLTTTFPPMITQNDALLDKITKALDIAKEHKVNIACLPELCMSMDWLAMLKSSFPEIIIIAGSYYDREYHNTCEILANSSNNIPAQFKIKPSEFEAPRPMGTAMKPGDTINIYETEYGKFVVLICRDFGNFISRLNNDVDIIFVPSYNEALERFHTEAHNHVLNYPSFIILANSAANGGTAIFGQLDRLYFPRLEQHNCKSKGDMTYKLCELGKNLEGIIIADFDIVHKSIQKPTPIDSDEVLISVNNIKREILS